MIEDFFSFMEAPTKCENAHLNILEKGCCSNFLQRGLSIDEGFQDVGKPSLSYVILFKLINRLSRDLYIVYRYESSF